MTTGFAIIGTGMIARFHAQAIQAIPQARLVGCYNHRAESAQEFAQTYACQAYSDLEAMLANPEISVVTICTPSGAHLEPALAAAQAGKHVLVEKPLEITLERCDQIIAACQQAGTQLGAILPSRFSPANLALKQAIDQGRFGRLTLGDTYVKWWRTQEYYDSGGWRGTWDLDGGGALMNQAIHNVDLLYWLMGDVESVQAMTATLAHERIEVEDTAVAALRFKNGALGVIEAATSAYPGLLKRTEIHGNKGSARVEQDDVTLWAFDTEAPGDDVILEALSKGSGFTAGASDPRGINHAGHRDQLADFLKAIDTGTAARVDGREGRKSVEIIRAIYQSAKTGQAVHLPLQGD